MNQTIMSIFQGRKIGSIIEKIECLSQFNQFYNKEAINPYEEKMKERMDEILNFLKLKEFLMINQYYSFHIKIANSTYYNWTLGERKEYLEAHSEDHLCKTIVMKNKKFDKSLENDFYQEFVCVIIQYTTSLNNEKLIKVMKNYYEDKTDSQISRKNFHFRLASEEENEKLTGYRHNSVTPFMFNEKMPLVISEPISQLEQGYFWLGGGHENTKLSKLIRIEF